MPPRRTSKKDSPAKLASRMKRRWRIVLMRKTGEVLGTVEAADAHAAEKVAAVQFELDEQQQRRLLVQAERGRANYKWLGSRDIAQ
jgi:hypothetical protein